MGPVYTYIFPISLSLFAIFRLRLEGFPPTGFTGKLNFLICLGLIFFNLLYLWWVWRKG